MKKITFLIASLGGGGAERVTIALGDYFIKKNYDVSFIVFSKTNNNYSVNEKIKLFYLPENNGIKGVFNKLSTLKQYLKNISPDYVFSLGIAYQYFIAGNLFNKYKIILSERNAPQYFYKWYELLYVKYCYKRSYKVVFQTEEAKDYFGTSIAKKSLVIPNPLSLNLPKPFDGSREKRIVSVCRLCPQKNLTMLLEAIQIVFEKFPDYILELYGKGEEKEKLENLAKKLNIFDKVKFYGQVANVHSYILSASLFVSSSNFEGMSNSMLEAMAIGLPVVCTDCPIGGARAVIKNNYNGILTPVGDYKEFANAIIEVLSDTEKAYIMSNNASKIRQDLELNKIAKQWESLINL